MAVAEASLMQMLWSDLTTGQQMAFPALPPDGTFALEQPQALAEFAVLGGYPQLQPAGVGKLELTTTLKLWGPDGQAFYDRMVYPAWGLENGRPHLVQLAWGSSSRDTFTGRPVGMPPVSHSLGAEPGVIFALDFELRLTHFRNAAPRLVSIKTGQVMEPPTQTYTARQGDTLQTVARKFGVSLERLAALNDYPPMLLEAGRKLRVPK